VRERERERERVRETESRRGRELDAAIPEYRRIAVSSSRVRESENE